MLHKLSECQSPFGIRYPKSASTWLSCLARLEPHCRYDRRSSAFSYLFSPERRPNDPGIPRATGSLYLDELRPIIDRCSLGLAIKDCLRCGPRTAIGNGPHSIDIAITGQSIIPRGSMLSVTAGCIKSQLVSYFNLFLHFSPFVSRRLKFLSQPLIPACLGKPHGDRSAQRCQSNAVGSCAMFEIGASLCRKVVLKA